MTAAYDETEFIDARWNWLSQQDASEFLLYLLNAMPEENET